MYPVLLSIGPLSVSSFGFFLALAFLFTVFISWRIAKVFDINEEKIFDLAIFTFLGGIIGARIYFVIFNLALFDDLGKMILINRYPGLSFWGGIIGGASALWYFSGRFKLNFWQVADFAVVGLIAGQIFGDIGCFLGGCSYGMVSSSFLATPIVGLLGKRFPITLIEAGLLLITFYYLWGQVVRFHFSGKIVAVYFMILGIIKFITEFYRGDSKVVVSSLWISHGHVWAVLFFITGLIIFYTQSKRNVFADIINLFRLISSPSGWRPLLSSLKRNCYNLLTAWKRKMGKISSFFQSGSKKLKRRLNVKSTPTNIG